MLFDILSLEYSVEGKKKLPITIIFRGETSEFYQNLMNQEKHSLCTLAKVIKYFIS